MKFAHTMIRVLDLEASLYFYKDILGMQELRRHEHEKGRFTLIFLAMREGEAELELTYNWDRTEAYTVGSNFGHIAFHVEDIYTTCASLIDKGVILARPPRDGHLAFIRSPDQISIEILQMGEPLAPKEPWLSMPNNGEW